MNLLPAKLLGTAVLCLLLGLLLPRPLRGEPSTADLNVVLFLIDDLGWRDLGCQGSPFYRTPNIDRLAAQSARFTDAYAACNVCSPTRAAILTGKYPARLQLTQWLPAGRWDRKRHAMKEARYVRELPLEEITLAETLRESGYATGFVGKWHLGGAPFYLPQHQGFDVNIAGDDHGAPGHYFYPFRGTWTIPTTGLKVVKQTLPDGKPGDYLVDRLSEAAVEFVHDHAERPFFLMLSHYAVHTPLQAKEAMIEPYAAIPEAERQGHPAYAAMVESVDQSVGNVLRALEEKGVSDRTLILFTSDNGGFARATSNAPLRANKGTNYEGGIRVPLLIRWPGVTDEGRVVATPAISTDFYPTILSILGLPSRPAQHLDGVDLTPALKGNRLPDRDLFWHYPHYNRHPSAAPTGVVRSGRWKLIEYFETGQKVLYDLETDIGETHDLSGNRPGVAATLASRLEEWRLSVRADRMLANPEYEAGE